ncbi:MAG: tRNA (5-methylaminomethyl-2-thiouridine)(34)-methyltransferase MnmD [Flavobacteriales bacterium]|nr:tRNA (5-methylaminomethyl-2-thiouridine)(34)-methyltransferase MnmD [Flavobacteriales bacterium]
MEREVIATSDGVSTLFIPKWNETYHSKHGVMSEAKHVFIKNGLDKINSTEATLLEIGFGTGFNALLTFFESLESRKKINYYGVEKFILNWELVESLQYENHFNDKQTAKEVLKALHNQDKVFFEKNFPHFRFTLINEDFFQLKEVEIPSVDLIYFDAFGARVQPELWEEELFEIIHSKMKKNGLLTTYSSKGSARRALEKVGFKVEKLAGPIGKREMINAWKI